MSIATVQSYADNSVGQFTPPEVHVGQVVYWGYHGPNEGHACAAIVCKVGGRAISLFKYDPSFQGPQLKDAVHHHQDPLLLKQDRHNADWFPGVWWEYDQPSSDADARLATQVAHLTERVEQLEAKTQEPAKRGPGRPPKN
jgi:hypothetical protein